MPEKRISHHYEEEDHAKNLYEALQQRFAGDTIPTDVTIEGGGVQWRCTVKRGNLSTVTHCFATLGPEYLTTFVRDSTTIAWGRASSMVDTLNAIHRWLQGRNLPQLYEEFSFVDSTKRALLRIRDEMTESFPQLGKSALAELQAQTSDIYYLWFRSTERTCKISFYGKNEHPDAVFSWDGCALFQFRADDIATLAAVAKRWLCEGAMPSLMRKEFEWLEIGPLADYYEQGNPIEGEFLKSWDDIESFYASLNNPIVPQIQRMITQMRERGYDRTLRSGQSLWSFIVSRSRRHGLRQDQPMIQFDFRENGMDVTRRFGTENKAVFEGIAFNPAIEELFQELQTQPID